MKTAAALPPPPIGVKLDAGKDRWDLLPWPELSNVAAVMTHGAVKYGEGNWRGVPNARDRYFAAALRHITLWRSGTEQDEDSRLPHLAHAICSLLFLMEFDSGRDE